MSGANPDKPAEHTIESLQRLFAAGRLTSQTLVARYLERIQALDRRGPRVNSIIELNPDAPAIARELDRERKAGHVRGPLHGVPILVKDNIATADRMDTTAGSLALAGVRVPRDAFIVTRLREAGAVVLGKTNLSEWANFRSTRSSSGWSSRGGLTRNPYALDRSCSGSSSGTAAAIAANFAVAGIGTETNGSIYSPAARCGLVGFKPTVGRVSRDGVIPIAASQDTAGPMTRCVADAAVLFDAIAGRDGRDAATHAAPATGPTASPASAALGTDGLAGVRIGIVRTDLPRHEGVVALFETALGVLRACGATLVDDIPMPPRSSQAERELLLHEFNAGIASYLREFAADSGLRSLADLIAFNRANAARAMPHFGQELFEQAAECEGLDSARYREARAIVGASQAAIDGALQANRLDALAAPSGGLAWRIDLVNGDASTGGCPIPAAVAGYPHVTVPMGLVAGLPAGLSLVTARWRDAEALRYAFVYEQASRRRVAPAFARKS